MTFTLADVVWAPFILEHRLLAWWVILAGLAVELPFVRLLTRFDVKKCIIADVAMNAASTIIGLIFIPAAGVGLRFVSEATFYHRFNVGIVNPIAFVPIFLIAVMLNSAIELSVLRFGFKQRLGGRGFWWLSAANALSVGIALWSLFLFPPPHT